MSQKIEEEEGPSDITAVDTPQYGGQWVKEIEIFEGDQEEEEEANDAQPSTLPTTIAYITLSARPLSLLLHLLFHHLLKLALFPLQIQNSNSNLAWPVELY